MGVGRSAWAAASILIGIAIVPGSPLIAQPAAPTIVPSLDSPIEQLDANSATRSVLDQELPELKKSELYGDIKVMSLRQLQAYLPQRLTPDLMSRIGDRLTRLRWQK